MCGIVFIINPFGILSARSAKGFMSDALTADAVRGPHSTGVFTVDRNGDATTRKSAIVGGQFVGTKLFEAATASIASDLAIVGHNRWATVGKVDKKNAHPFIQGTISLVHNGTVRDLSNLPGNGKFGTDSETIANAIDNSADPNAIDVLESIRGDYVLVWHDTLDNCLRIARNKNRPLYLAKGKYQPFLLGASEPKMLEWIAQRNTLSIEEPTEVPVGKLLRFDLGRASSERIKPVVRDFTPYVPPVITYASRKSYPSWDDYEKDVNTGLALPSSVRSASSASKETICTLPPSSATVFLERLGLPALNTDDVMATVHPQIMNGVKVHKFALSPNTYTLLAGMEYYEKVEAYEAEYNVDVECVVHSLATTATEEALVGGACYVSGPIAAVQQRFNKGTLEKVILILSSTKTDVLDAQMNFVHDHSNRSCLPKKQGSTVVSLEDKREQQKPASKDTTTTDTAAGQPNRLVRGPYDKDIALSNWLLKVIGGCGCCNNKLEPREANLVTWYGDLPVCHHCEEGFMCDSTTYDQWVNSLPSHKKARFSPTKH